MIKRGHQAGLALAFVACTPFGSGPADSVDADAGIDAAADGSDALREVYLDNGSYTLRSLTCHSATRGTDIDILAYAVSKGVLSIDYTIAGDNGAVLLNLNSGGAAACTETVAFKLAYPRCEMVMLTTAPNFTCSAKCAPATCTAGTQTSIVSSSVVSKSGGTITLTQVLDAPIVAEASFQRGAGCQVGDTQVSVLIKQ